jgi:putative copper resistance protein D
MIYARAIHFAATIMAAGMVFFIVFVAAPAFRAASDDARVRAALWPRLAFIAWFSLVLAVGSGAVWLVLTAASMSGEPPADVFSGGVLGTVLSQTQFGLAWTARLLLACILAATFVPLLSAQPSRSWISVFWIGAVAVIAAAAFAGVMAWAGHAVGGQGAEAFVHPTADILHLIAAAAWVGALLPLAFLLGAVGKDEASVAITRAAVLRFSTLGLVSVGTLLVTGIVNTWYLVGSVAALTGTYYGQLLLAKIALFAAMVAIAAINRLRFTPRLAGGTSTSVTQNALHQLHRNAAIEALAGAAIICIVAVLGTEPPASHANHHAAYGAIPADAAFVHIHTEQGMADVMITPGRVGPARATIHLWNEDLEQLDVREVKFSVAPPAGGSNAGGSKPEARVAVQDADGAWQVDGLALSQPGNWTVTVDAALGPNKRLVLSAPIVIEPGP